MQLLPHSSEYHAPVQSFDLEAKRQADGSLALRFRLEGDLAGLLVPKARESRSRLKALLRDRRADGLWRHTCFEAFIATPGSAAYCELNFSPSGEWAAYAFTGYRAGRALLEMPAPPQADWELGQRLLELSVILDPAALLRDAGPLRLGASAVLEAQSGTISYWALRHPAGQPDFHHPESFVWEFP